MRAFHVTIRQAGRVIRFAALGHCSCDVLCAYLDRLDGGLPFTVCVLGVRHGQ